MSFIGVYITLGRINVSDHFREPSAHDQADFLLRLYFSTGSNDLTRVLRRAYQDLSRTVHGIGDYPKARPLAQEALRSELVALPSRAHVADQSSFDAWHEDVCCKLSTAYANGGYSHFCVGQAQKWLNMALKYIYVFGEARLPGYARLYGFCHVPIDNVILHSPEFRGLTPLHKPWSRITSYPSYLEFQVAVRERFPNSSPLAVEFWAWQGNARF